MPENAESDWPTMMDEQWMEMPNQTFDWNYPPFAALPAEEFPMPSSWSGPMDPNVQRLNQPSPSITRHSSLESLSPFVSHRSVSQRSLLSGSMPLGYPEESMYSFPGQASPLGAHHASLSLICPPSSLAHSPSQPNFLNNSSLPESNQDLLSTSLPSKKPRGKKHTSTTCFNCGTSTTSLWRRDGAGNPLCNACGLFFKLHGVVRPLSMKKDVIRKRNRAKPGTSLPANLGNQDLMEERFVKAAGKSRPPNARRSSITSPLFQEASSKASDNASGSVAIPIPTAFRDQSGLLDPSPSSAHSSYNSSLATSFSHLPLKGRAGPRQTPTSTQPSLLAHALSSSRSMDFTSGSAPAQSFGNMSMTGQGAPGLDMGALYTTLAGLHVKQEEQGEGNTFELGEEFTGFM